MNDIGFIGDVAIGGTILIPVVCRNGSDVPTTPDADPTYTVFDSDGTQVGTQTGSMTLNPGSKTGFQAVVLTASTGNGYSAGESYTVHISYEISSTAYTAIAMFSVQ